mgnify:CR=1 FL=1
MNKNELISALAGATNLNQTQCSEVLQSFIETVTNELKGGSEVKIIGFGTFKISKRSDIYLKGSCVIRFKSAVTIRTS